MEEHYILLIMSLNNEEKKIEVTRSNFDHFLTCLAKVVEKIKLVGQSWVCDQSFAHNIKNPIEVKDLELLNHFSEMRSFSFKEAKQLYEILIFIEKITILYRDDNFSITLFGFSEILKNHKPLYKGAPKPVFYFSEEKRYKAWEKIYKS